VLFISHFLILLCLCVTIVFYIIAFMKHQNKWLLFVSAIIVVATVILGTVLVAPSFLYLLYAMAILDFPQGYGLLAIRVLKPAIGGFFEEFFRSSLVVIFGIAKYKYIKLEKKEGSAYLKILDNHILGLAFLYSVFESARIAHSALLPIAPDLVKNAFGITSGGAYNLADLSLIFIPVFFAGVVLRYYLHLKLLQFSVYSLAAKKYFLFILALLTHFLANFTLLYSVLSSQEALIARMVIVEIIFIITISFLLDKLKLREQIIANENARSR